MNRTGIVNIPDHEIPDRIEAVRRAKAALGGLDLTLAQLDRVIPAVECRRTRTRRRRLAEGLTDIPNASVRER